MSDISLKKISAKLAAVAGRRNLDSKDMEVLREVREGIASVLQGLKECDVCGAAVTETVKLEIEGVRATVCSSCGIKALRSKSLVLKAAKKREATREKETHKTVHRKDDHREPKSHAPSPASHKHTVKPFKTEPHPAAALSERPAPAKSAPTQPTLFGESASGSSDKGDNAIEEIARDAGSKIMTVKKVQQVASAIAFPMNFDRTSSYTRMELQGQGLNVPPDELRKILVGLSKKAGLKIKD